MVVAAAWRKVLRLTRRAMGVSCAMRCVDNGKRLLGQLRPLCLVFVNPARVLDQSVIFMVLPSSLTKIVGSKDREHALRRQPLVSARLRSPPFTREATGTPPAPMIPETCFALRNPTIAPVTAGLSRVQAMATSPGLRPWRFPICAALDESQIPGQQRFLEVRKISAPVLGLKVCNSFRVIVPVSNPADIGE